MDSDEITITVFDSPPNINKISGDVLTIEWDDLVNKFSKAEPGPKMGSYFVRHQCNGIRSNENMKAHKSSIIIIDGDQGPDGDNCPPPDYVCDILQDMNYEFILYTSHSHTPPEKNKYRIILKTSRAVSEEEYKIVYRWILKAMYDNGVRIEPNTESCTMSQPWFLPRCDTARIEHFFHGAGGLHSLPVDEILQEMPEGKQPEQVDLTTEQVEQLKAGTPPCVAYFSTNTDLEATGNRNFNTISMVLCAYGLSIGADVEQIVSDCSIFIEEYGQSNSLKTPAKRLQNFSQRFKSMKTHGYKFHCACVHALGAPASAFDCDACPVHETEAQWDFEDAEFYIQKISEQLEILSSKQVITVVSDIFSHQDFDILEIGILRAAVKKHLKINKGDIDYLLKKQQEEAEETEEPLTHIEIADNYLASLGKKFSHIVGAEGSIWCYGANTNGIFEQDSIKHCAVHVARQYKHEKNCKKGADYKSISNLSYDITEQSNFFSKAQYGLPGATFFYSINGKKEIEAKQYSASLRQRWKLPVDPAQKTDLTQAPMFQKYLSDTFPDDPHQIKKLQEITGALICGVMKDLQQVVLFYGTGENGKSVMLDIFTHIFPDNLRSSIKPENMDQAYYQAMLAGKIINIVGEIEKSQPIKAGFKDIVSCDTPLTARLPYKEPFEFLPVCGHVFSINGYPLTKDHSHGFYRRWAMVHFEHKVKPGQKIVRLGKKIAQAEMSQLLSWGLDGAKRLIENNMILTETKQHNVFMENWQSTGDSVFNFLSDQDAVFYSKHACVQQKDFYKIYSDWCRFNAGLRAVGRNNFYERVKLKLKQKQLSGGARVFVGIGVIDFYEGCILKQYQTPLVHYSYEYLP